MGIINQFMTGHHILYTGISHFIIGNKQNPLGWETSARRGLAMSTKSPGYADASSPGRAKELPAASTLGQEVRQMGAEKLPSKPGTRFLLYHGVSKLMLNKTWKKSKVLWIRK